MKTFDDVLSFTKNEQTGYKLIDNLAAIEPYDEKNNYYYAYILLKAEKILADRVIKSAKLKLDDATNKYYNNIDALYMEVLKTIQGLGFYQPMEISNQEAFEQVLDDACKETYGEKLYKKVYGEKENQ